MNYFRQITLVILFIWSKIVALDIPINPAEKGDVSNWLFMGPVKKDTDAYDLIGKIEKDPLNYFTTDTSNDDLKIINIKSQIKYGGQFYYQLYDNLDKGDIIFGFSQINSKKKQKVIFDNNSARGNFEIYLNGNFVKNIDNQREDTEVYLKKGLNDVLLKIYPDNYSLESTSLYHRFFFNIMPETRFEISGRLKDINGNPLPNKNVTAWDNTHFHNTTTDENGVYKVLI